MPRKKKPTKWKRVKNVLNKIFSTQVALGFLLSLIAAGIISLAWIAHSSYSEWMIDKATITARIHEDQVQGHLNNIAPMIEMCITRGGLWVWLGIDPAEIRGICAKPKQQSTPAPKKQSYEETL